MTSSSVTLMQSLQSSFHKRVPHISILEMWVRRMHRYPH